MTYVVSTIAGFWARYGFDSTMFKSRNLIWSLVILVQIGAIVGCVMFIVFALKKALAGIAFTVVFTFFTCNMLRNFLSDKDFFKLSCFSLAQTSDTKTLFLSGVFAVLTIAAMLALTHWIFRRTEVR
ncbi:MAG: ABC transporter permease, partial [Ruminococcus sp.]|nr:ABC transporter permease [Ruminococcus sp.]